MSALYTARTREALAQFLEVECEDQKIHMANSTNSDPNEGFF